MAKTNSGLLAYAKAQIGLPYWFGCYGQTATASLYNSMKSQYPSYYTDSDFTSQYGKRVHDCSGLIKGYVWSDSATSTPVYNSSQDINAASMYAKATKKGTISTFPKYAGCLLFRGSSTTSISHVGIYGGDGYVYEAKGHKYGVVKSVYSSSNWNYWGQSHLITDDTSSSSSSSLSTTLKSADVSYTASGTVTASTLNVRYGPSSSEYAVITTISKGTEVSINGKNSSGTWYRITIGTVTGWVSASYISINTEILTTNVVSPDVEYIATGTVTATALNVRYGPSSSDYKVISTISKDDTVSIKGKNSASTWYYIVTKSVTGWVSASYIKITVSATKTTTANLNLRGGRGTSYSSLAVIPKGTKVPVSDLQSGWYKVTYNGITGYSSATYLS